MMSTQSYVNNKVKIGSNKNLPFTIHSLLFIQLINEYWVLAIFVGPFNELLHKTLTNDEE